MAGKAARIAGISARGEHIDDPPDRAGADLLSRLAQPFFCAAPSDTPIDPNGVRAIPSAGPYRVASYTPGQGVVLTRNPNYHGSRPHRLARIELAVGIPGQRAVAQTGCRSTAHRPRALPDLRTTRRGPRPQRRPPPRVRQRIHPRAALRTHGLPDLRVLRHRPRRPLHQEDSAVVRTTPEQLSKTSTQRLISAEDHSRPNSDGSTVRSVHPESAQLFGNCAAASHPSALLVRSHRRPKLGNRAGRAARPATPPLTKERASEPRPRRPPKRGIRDPGLLTRSPTAPSGAIEQSESPRARCSGSLL
jgi:hypothetical protein